LQDDKVYCANQVSGSVTVIEGASNQVIATVTVGLGPCALCYNSKDNKVYCANHYSANATVIGGATNQVIATIAVGSDPCALCYEPVGNKVYCANWSGSNVTAIDGASDSVVKTITVGSEPTAMTCNPVQNRIYAANYGSNSISVIRDSALGVAERAPLTECRVSLEAYPNPFSGRVRLQLTANGSRPVVRVYDVNGALVRDFGATGSLAPLLSRSLVWDGTDDLGHRLPNGVYICRVSDGPHTVAVRELTLLRE
jgi:YVTN family beta-propeller protein